MSKTRLLLFIAPLMVLSVIRGAFAGMADGPQVVDSSTSTATPVVGFGLPKVTALTKDFIIHDLAVDGAQILSGSFSPAGPKVMLDVQAAYAMLGASRAALLLYVGQPDVVGSCLYDSGGKPLPGVRWYSVGSINGESAWANTTYRRLVLDVAPGKDVTWQLVGGIIGGAATVTIDAPRQMTITPDGKKAFVTSPRNGTVTPVVLGRPGYSFNAELKPSDEAVAAVRTGKAATYISADNAHVVVSNAEAHEDHVSILSASSNEVLRQVKIPGGLPRGSAISPDGVYAAVGTAAGKVARITLATGETRVVETGGRIVATGILNDGKSILAADSESGNVYRIALNAMTVDSTIKVGDRPHVVRVAPDGQVWVLCRPEAPAKGRLKRIDPQTNTVVRNFELPFPDPTDAFIVPVAGQSSEIVRTAWLVFDQSRYSEFYISGPFEGIAHTFHTAAFGNHADAASSIAVSDFGEIWVVQPELNRVWKWPGGRLLCRADEKRPYSGVFFGEYCEVSVYGAK